MAKQKKDAYLEKTKHGGLRSLFKRAIELGYKVTFFEGASLAKLEYKGKYIFMRPGTVPLWRQMGNLTKDKDLTKTVLEASGIRTPRGILAGSFVEAKKLVKAKKLAFPLIVKPVDGSRATRSIAAA